VPTLQFVPIERRQRVVSHAYEALALEGVFLPRRCRLERPAPPVRRLPPRRVPLATPLLRRLDREEVGGAAAHGMASDMLAITLHRRMCWLNNTLQLA